MQSLAWQRINYAEPMQRVRGIPERAKLSLLTQFACKTAKKIATYEYHVPLQGECLDLIRDAREQRHWTIRRIPQTKPHTNRSAYAMRARMIRPARRP